MITLGEGLWVLTFVPHCASLSLLEEAPGGCAPSPSHTPTDSKQGRADESFSGLTLVIRVAFLVGGVLCLVGTLGSPLDQ